MTKDEVHEYSKKVTNKATDIGVEFGYCNYTYDLLYEDDRPPDEIYKWLQRIENRIDKAKRISKLTNVELQEVCRKYRRDIAKLKMLNAGNMNKDIASNIEYAEEELTELEDRVFNRISGENIFNMIKYLDKAILGYE